MQNLKQINDDIRKLVQDTIDSGAIGHVNFFTEQVIQERSDVYGDDAEFYTVCARETIVRMVKKAVSKYDPPESTPILDGFEQLRKAYPLHRGDEHVLVPVHLCSDEELEERAQEFDKAAKGMRKHAQELRQYIMSRREKSAL